ncbi:hypothetical protein BV25DRAFT_1835152 [Artomyces pyxidatus]|uniref:Uncharacterized protein n=1 Tax=Artomyces pyxidatus TaxID=48021 RepID=A0ACB8TGB7_9AGAM|nr:hypothetical protein BV25DRAFT_1835152 [Artomyces pyxidatus]
MYPFEVTDPHGTIHHTQFYPSGTMRHIFSPERSPSPVAHLSSMRNVFPPEVAETSSSEDRQAQDCEALPEQTATSRVERDACLERKKSTSHGAKQSNAGPSNPPSASRNQDDRIARPSGSLSKPGSGGYSLASVLGWETKEYRALQVWYMHIVLDAVLIRRPEEDS